MRKDRKKQRDRIALVALQGILSSPGEWWHKEGDKKVYYETITDYCRLSYLVADTMLEESENKS